MAEQRSSASSAPRDAAPGVYPGGYHSRGVPGEEAAARRRMRIVKLSDTNKFVPKTQPVKGGVSAESTSAGRLEDERTSPATTSAAERTVYVLAQREEEALETPVFHAGEANEDEAIAVFSDRNKAILYLQVADWRGTHEPRPLSPMNLGQWLEEALNNGIDLVAVDPDRQAHIGGEPQPVLLLSEQTDRSGENLYREIMNIART